MSNYPDVPGDSNFERYQSTDRYFYNNLVVIRRWATGACGGNSDCFQWGSCGTKATGYGHICDWFGCECPINYPFLLDGEKMVCDTFTSNIETNAPSLNSSLRRVPFVNPVNGGTVTTEHINAIRDSLLDEYTSRRWVLTDSTKRTGLTNLEEIVGEIIDAPSIQNLATFINYLINRGVADGDYDDYNFLAECDSFSSAGNGGFSTTNNLSVTAPSTTDTVTANNVLGLMQVVDNLRRACICNTNCSCFSNCDCNYNCKCNYSDIRLKENVKDIRGKDVINKLPAKSWKYTGINGTHFSFIAQDVKKTLENMGYTDQKVVEADQNGLLKISRPYELIAFLWDNVKDLNKSYEDLNEKVNKLLEKINKER